VVRGEWSVGEGGIIDLDSIIPIQPETILNADQLSRGEQVCPYIPLPFAKKVFHARRQLLYKQVFNSTLIIFLVVIHLLF
jgi:hypothetical protein